MRRFDEINDNRYDAIMDAAIDMAEAFEDVIVGRANNEGWSKLERDALAHETVKIISRFFNV